MISSMRPSSRLRRCQVILKAHKHSGSLLEALQVRISAATPRSCSPPPGPGLNFRNLISHSRDWSVTVCFAGEPSDCERIV